MFQPICIPRNRAAVLASALTLTLTVAGCGGGGGGAGASNDPPPVPEPSGYSVSASVSGLLGTGLVLTLNQVEEVSVSANGVASFSGKLTKGQLVNLAVKTQPGAPAQLCTVQAAPQAIEADTTVAVHCDYAPPRFAYIGGTVGIDAMSADRDTGALSLVQTLTLPKARRVSLTPDQSLLLAMTSDDLLIRTFHVDQATGRIAQTAATPVAARDGSVWRIAIHPNGKFVYVPGGQSQRIFVHHLSPANGQLEFKSEIQLAGSPGDLVLSPDGRFAYVTVAANALEVFTIDPDTGTLTPVQSLAAGPSIASIALDPKQRLLYVAGFMGIDVFRLDAAAGTATFVGRVGTATQRIAVHPSGNFLFASHFAGRVASYGVDAATGALTLLGTMVPVAPVVEGLVSAGSFLVAASDGSDLASVYSFDSLTGQLALVGTTAASADPVGLAVAIVK